jgi:hypothetical protein
MVYIIELTAHDVKRIRDILNGRTATAELLDKLPKLDDETAELKPQDYDTDQGVAMVYDTLCDRGHDEVEIAALLDGYDGDLWMEVFGPAVDRAAECIGVSAYPDEDEDEDDESDWMKSACEDEDHVNNQ